MKSFLQHLREEASKIPGKMSDGTSSTPTPRPQPQPLPQPEVRTSPQEDNYEPPPPYPPAPPPKHTPPKQEGWNFPPETPEDREARRKRMDDFYDKVRRGASETPSTPPTPPQPKPSASDPDGFITSFDELPDSVKQEAKKRRQESDMHKAHPEWFPDREMWPGDVSVPKLPETQPVPPEPLSPEEVRQGVEDWAKSNGETPFPDPLGTTRKPEDSQQNESVQLGRTIAQTLAEHWTRMKYIK